MAFFIVAVPSSSALLRNTLINIPNKILHISFHIAEIKLFFLLRAGVHARKSKHGDKKLPQTDLSAVAGEWEAESLQKHKLRGIKPLRAGRATRSRCGDKSNARSSMIYSSRL